MDRDCHANRFADNAAMLFGQCALMLGWRPDEFWAATPAEVASIRNALNGPQKAQGLSRADVDRLMETDNG